MNNKNKFYLVSNYLLSLLFSFTLIIMNRIKFNPNEIPLDFTNNFHFYIKTILLSIPIFLSLYGLNIIISKINIKKLSII